MFIPNPKYINIGDCVVITRDITVEYGTFTKGHTFEVVKIQSDPSGQVILEVLSADPSTEGTPIHDKVIMLNRLHCEKMS